MCLESVQYLPELKAHIQNNNCNNNNFNNKNNDGNNSTNNNSNSNNNIRHSIDPFKPSLNITENAIGSAFFVQLSNTFKSVRKTSNIHILFST